MGLNALVRRGSLPGLAPLYPPHALPDLNALHNALIELLPRAEASLMTWLDLPPQTNEPMRSGPLMAGLLVIADQTHGMPVALYEVGASAGLVLMLDRYGHRLGTTTAGAEESPVLIAPKWDGSSPPRMRLQIARRQGSDLEPLDVRDTRDRERLLAYVWADQADRLARVEAAIDIAARDPPRLDRAEAAEWTERTLDPAPEAGMTRVLMHAVAMQYAGQETRERIRAHAERLGRKATDQAPFAWLCYEADAEFDDQGSLRLTLWPGGTEEVLAIGDTHGEHLRWIR